MLRSARKLATQRGEVFTLFGTLQTDTRRGIELLKAGPLYQRTMMQRNWTDGAPHASRCVEGEYGSAAAPGVSVRLIRQLAGGQCRHARPAIEAIVAGPLVLRCRHRLCGSTEDKHGRRQAQDARGHAVASRLAPSVDRTRFFTAPWESARGCGRPPARFTCR